MSALIDSHDRQSAVWKRLKEYYEARLTMLRSQNDANLTADQTARLRGRIVEVKRLLDLDTDKPVVDEGELFKD
jgi:uncharacterized protein involved in exopolysaccharide biosynthesis